MNPSKSAPPCKKPSPGTTLALGPIKLELPAQTEWRGNLLYDKKTGRLIAIFG